MKLGFATDIHLDHIKAHRGDPKKVDLGKITRVGRNLTRNVDALVLGGDLSVGHLLKEHMTALLAGATCPVYFVLGNHDFWCSPEDQVWRDAQSFGASALDFLDYVELDPETALVGVSGWYDTRAGNVFQPGVIMPEFEAVTRLMGKGPVQVFKWLIWLPEVLHEVHRICKDWADEQTRKVLPKLETAAKKYRRVFLVTHVPPWVEACWSEKGPLSRDNSPEWLPWSVNVGLGMRLEDVARSAPEVQFRVLSGHTHGEGETKITPNLSVYSGKAVYGQPKISRVFETLDG